MHQNYLSIISPLLCFYDPIAGSLIARTLVFPPQPQSDGEKLKVQQTICAAWNKYPIIVWGGKRPCAIEALSSCHKVSQSLSQPVRVWGVISALHHPLTYTKTFMMRISSVFGEWRFSGGLSVSHGSPPPPAQTPAAIPACLDNTSSYRFGEISCIEPSGKQRKIRH